MTPFDVYTKLTAIICDVFDNDDLVAVSALSAKDVDGWDSLSNLRLMMTVEKEFAISFSASDIGKLKDVGELATLILAKTSC